ncbi:MAG: DUF1326 domain-containing protein [Gemmatimonadota bacterium]
MTDPAIPKWRIQGNLVVACNCDYGCPCNFNGLPTTGKCEGNWNWAIEQGHFGDVSLSGIAFCLAVNWPRAIHEGNGEGIFVIDEKADQRQREALMTLVSGKAGGPWQIVRATISKLHGPEYAPIEISVNGFTSHVHAGTYVTVETEPVRNKTTQAQVHPRAILPEGFIFKEANLAASTTFRISGPVNFEHSGRYAATAPFDYQSS